MHQLPELGRGSRVRRVGDPAGSFWHIVDVEVHEKATAQTAGSHASDTETDDGADTEQPAPESTPDADESSASQGAPFAATVYGVQFYRGGPMSGMVSAVKGAHKRVWEMLPQ